MKTIVHTGKVKLINILKLDCFFVNIERIPLQFLSLSEGGATVLTNALLLVVLASENEERHLRILSVVLSNKTSLSVCLDGHISSAFTVFMSKNKLL